MHGQDKNISMGLGAAIRRFMEIEFQCRMGGGRTTEGVSEEREMLLEALDHFTLNLGFSCDISDAPDDVGIFKKSAATSCCRLQPPVSAAKAPLPSTPGEPAAPKKTPRTRGQRSAKPTKGTVTQKTASPSKSKAGVTGATADAVPSKPPTKKKGLLSRMFGEKETD